MPSERDIFDELKNDPRLEYQKRQEHIVMRPCPDTAVCRCSLLMKADRLSYESLPEASEPPGLSHHTVKQSV